MFKEAFTSLRHDKARSFFYWLTFLFTALFIFLFFSIGLSDSVGVTMFYAKNDTPTNLMLLSVILCAIEVFFANDFYVRQKAKELSVMLICGAKFTQLAAFLLIQTAFLSITAIVCAVGIGVAFMPLLEGLLSQYTASPFHINISFQAVIWTALVIGYVLLWTLIFNLAFAYRNSAVQLLKEDKNKAPREKLLSFGFEPSIKTKQMISLIAFLLPIAGYYKTPEALLLFSMISLVGLNDCIQTIVFPTIEKRMHKHLDNPIEVAVLGFLRNDFVILKVNLYLLVACMILLISLLLTSTSSLDLSMTLIAYAAMNLLLCMSLCFRYATEIYNRRNSFETLYDLGFSRKQLLSTVRKEILSFFGFTLVVILLYIGNMLASEAVYGYLKNWKLAVVLLVSAVLPIVLSALLIRLVYHRCMMEKGNLKYGMA